MKNKHIKDLMITIQMEYLDILKTLSEKMTMDNVYLLIDEIKQFWIKNEMKIEFIIENILDNNNITFFTAATVLDLSGGDQFPFLLCGEYHIFDDPLFSHLENANLDLGSYSQFLYEKATITINDNIRIIENHSDLIWVIPIRLLYSSIDKDVLNRNVENIFVSLLNGVTDLNDYFSKCKNIDDIDKHFKPELINSVNLTVNERHGMTLKEKFACIKKEKAAQKLNAPNDAVLFYMTLGGLIGQSIDIIYTSSTSRLIPFIRYEPTYHTIMLLMNNFKTIDKQFIDMETKITRYFLIQLFINKDDYIGFDLNIFSDLVAKHGVRQKLESLQIDINDKGSFEAFRIQIEAILEMIKKDLPPPV